MIIPSYKPNKEFHQCLRALLEQRTEVDFEIIVADSSPDDIQEIYQKSFPQVKFYRKQIKTLPGTARNFGVTKAKGKLLAFTDTDCVVDSNWLNKILEAHQNGHKVICGSIENGYPENFISQAEYLMEFGDFLPESES